MLYLSLFLYCWARPPRALSLRQQALGDALVGVNGARLDGLSFKAAVALIKAAGLQGGPRVFTVRRCEPTSTASLEAGTEAGKQAGRGAESLRDAAAAPAAAASADTAAAAAAATATTAAVVAPAAAADNDTAESVEPTAASGGADEASEDAVAAHNATVNVATVGTFVDKFSP